MINKPIHHAWGRLRIRFLGSLALTVLCLGSGCQYAHRTLDRTSLGTLVGEEPDALIKKEAIKDSSFPAATDTVSNPD